MRREFTFTKKIRVISAAQLGVTVPQEVVSVMGLKKGDYCKVTLEILSHKREAFK